MQALTLGTFIFFTALVGLLTWLLTRKDRHDTSAGYFLGGRTLTSGYIAGSLLLTNLSTEQLVGLNGAAFNDGLCVMAWEVIAGMSLVLMALVFLPRYLKSGIATIPQFLELRYDHHTRTITSLIFIVAYAGILLPIVLYSGATGLNSILDVRTLFGFTNDSAALWFTVWLIGIIGSIYAIFGGLRTVAVSDTLNGIGLLVGGCLITWFAFAEISPDAPMQALPQLMSEHPEKFNSIGGPGQSVPFSTLFTGVLLLNLFYWCTNQQIIQRTFGASSLKEGQQGVLLAGALKVLAPVILVFPGIVAFHLYGVWENEESERVAIRDVIREPIAVIGEFTREGDAKEITLYGEAAAAVLGLDAGKIEPGTGAQLQETFAETKRDHEDGSLTVQTVLQRGDLVTFEEEGFAVHRGVLDDDQIRTYIPPRLKDYAYGTLVREVMPPYLAGFLAAAIIGAILSSFNSALNSTATLFSLGVYKTIFHREGTDRDVINAGKIFGVVIALVAMTVAPLLQGQESLFGYLQKMNGLYFIPIFSVVLVGMLTKRVPSFAANLALLLGFAAIAAGYFVPSLAVYVDWMHEFHFLGLVFATLVGVMLLLGFVAPRSTPWVQEDSGDVDLTPWKWATPVGLLLIVIVLSVYIAFADPSVLR